MEYAWSAVARTAPFPAYQPPSSCSTRSNSGAATPVKRSSIPGRTRISSANTGSTGADLRKVDNRSSDKSPRHQDSHACNTSNTHPRQDPAALVPTSFPAAAADQAFIAAPTTATPGTFVLASVIGESVGEDIPRSEQQRLALYFRDRRFPPTLHLDSPVLCTLGEAAVSTSATGGSRSNNSINCRSNGNVAGAGGNTTVEPTSDQALVRSSGSETATVHSVRRARPTTKAANRIAPPSPHNSLSAAVAAAAPAGAAPSEPERRLPHHAAMPAEPGVVLIKPPAKDVLTRAESASGTSTSAAPSTHTVMSSDGAAEPAAEARQQKAFVVRNGRTFMSDPSLPYPLPVDLAELHRQSLRTLLLFQLFGGPVCSPYFVNRLPTRVLEVCCGSAFWSMMCYRYYARHGHSGISFTGFDVAPLAPGTSTAAATDNNNSARGSASAAADGGRTSGPASFSAASPPWWGDGRPDKDMKWRFVQHDLRRLPWPFADDEFDLIMVKDTSLSCPTSHHQVMMDEILRVLTPGGIVEVWESDWTLRTLRPHVPDPNAGVGVGVGGSGSGGGGSGGGSGSGGGGGSGSGSGVRDDSSSIISESSTSSSGSSSSSSSEEDEAEAAVSLGAYIITPKTPLSSPVNNYIVECNGWIARALEARSLSPVPCTLIAPLLIQEAETLTGVGSRRLAVPLSEVKWEREGVGGVVTKDGKTYVETGRGRGLGGGAGRVGTGLGIGGALFGTGGSSSAVSSGGASGEGSAPPTSARPGRELTAAQAALRRTALLSVVQMVQSMEPSLREVSGKSQDEWDVWMGKMMNDLVNENGTYAGGECLEIGAWWARKRGRPAPS